MFSLYILVCLHMLLLFSFPLNLNSYYLYVWRFICVCVRVLMRSWMCVALKLLFCLRKSGLTFMCIAVGKFIFSSWPRKETQQQLYYQCRGYEITQCFDGHTTIKTRGMHIISISIVKVKIVLVTAKYMVSHTDLIDVANLHIKLGRRLDNFKDKW